jgi:hypothetical protein
VRALAQVELRCREHERFDPGCQACCFLKKTEHDLEALRTRRDFLFQQLKQRLQNENLIIIDLR